MHIMHNNIIRSYYEYERIIKKATPEACHVHGLPLTCMLCILK